MKEVLLVFFFSIDSFLVLFFRVNYYRVYVGDDKGFEEVVGRGGLFLVKLECLYFLISSLSMWEEYLGFCIRLW